MQYKIKNLKYIVSFLYIDEGFKPGLDSTSKRVKIDGVSAVVGDYVILDSDIDKTCS